MFDATCNTIHHTHTQLIIQFFFVTLHDLFSNHFFFVFKENYYKKNKQFKKKQLRYYMYKSLSLSLFYQTNDVILSPILKTLQNTITISCFALEHV